MTPITYKEAASMLQIAENSLAHGISRGVLTQLPRQGRKHYLIKEQVELFQGKQLSFNALTPTERTKWEQYKSRVNFSEREVPQVTPFQLPMMNLIRKKLKSLPTTPRLTGCS